MTIAIIIVLAVIVYMLLKIYAEITNLHDCLHAQKYEWEEEDGRK